MQAELRTYRETLTSSFEGIHGFSVEAVDGSIGHVEASTGEVAVGFFKVDAGYFGRTATIPALAITDIDLVERRVYLDLTIDQVFETLAQTTVAS